MNPFLPLLPPINDEDIAKSMRSLIPNLSIFHPLQHLQKPKIADTLATLFENNDALTNLRGILETVNASVTKTLLEENMKKWGQDILLSNEAILRQLAQAQPVPIQDVKVESEASEDEDNEEKKSQISEDKALILRKFYNQNPKPKREELESLANQIGHPIKAVKAWFQTTRVKDRKDGIVNNKNKTLAFNDSLQESLKTLNPLPASLVFSKFPTPPASSTTTDSQIQSPQSLSPQNIIPDLMTSKPAPLDLSTKRSTPSNTPPPLVINSDPETDEDEDNTSTSPPALTIQPPKIVVNNAKMQFEKMIQEKLVSLSPSTAAILPNEPLPKEKARVKVSAVVVSEADSGSVPAGSVTIPAPVGGIYKCDQCDKTFTKKSSITRHKYEHSGKQL